MQESFGFAAGDLAFIQQALRRRFGRLADFERREPVWQLVRSLIGAQTYDTVAEPALNRLRLRWRLPHQLAAASPAEVLEVIRDVTYAEDKAKNLVATLLWIRRERPHFDLSFLRDWPVDAALMWLERFPGVADKVAAATLNASTLRMRIFIVDSHVHRILLRFGFIGPPASPRHARAVVTSAAGSFDADELLELFAQLKRLGQTLCRPFNPRCNLCPIASRCQKKVRLGVPSQKPKAA